MFKFIDKIISGAQDFTPEELPYVARYIDTIGLRLDLPGIKDMWRQLSEDAQIVLAPAVLEKNARVGRADVVRFVLDEAAASPRHALFFEYIFGFPNHELDYLGNDVAHAAATSGNIETLDVVFRAARDSKGTAYCKMLVADTFMAVRHEHAFKWLYKRAGDIEVANDLIADRVWRGLLSVIEKEADKTLLHKMLGEIYNVDGANGVGRLMTLAVKNARYENYTPEYETNIIAMLHALPTIGGAELTRDVLQFTNGALFQNALLLPTRRIFSELYHACKSLNDAEFTGVTMEKIGTHVLIFQKNFVETILDVIEDKDPIRKHFKPDLIVQSAVMVWEEETGNQSKEMHEDVDPKAAADKNIVTITNLPWAERMAYHGKPVEFLLMAELHRHLGLPDIYPEQEKNLSQIAYKNPRMFKHIVFRMARLQGVDAVGDVCKQAFHFLADYAKTAGAEDFDIYHDCRKALGTVARLARRLGQFDKIVAAATENDHATLRKVEYVWVNDVAARIYDAMDPESRQKASVGSYLPWKDLWEGKIQKSAFWVEYTNRETRWRMVTGKEAPDFHLTQLSPYRFKRKLYDQLLPYMRHAHDLESAGANPEVQAYKLSVLFSSMQEVDRYLDKWQKVWGKENPCLFHDACLFNLPKGSWDTQYWKRIIMKYGPKAFPYFGRAHELENAINGAPMPEKIADLKELMLKMGYKRGSEDLDLARVANSAGLDEVCFDATLDEWKTYKKTKDFMPDIAIRGEEIGMPGVSFTRLAPDDPLGFVLGIVTGNCQSINDNGAPCVRYGMSSPYSGFYTWILDKKASILGQSWAFIDQKNNLVFDSFERVDPKSDAIVLQFLEQAAHEICGRHSFNDNGQLRVIQSVRLGTKGKTPQLNLPKVSDPQRPVDYSGLYDDGTPALDSREQYAISPRNHRQVTANPGRPLLLPAPKNIGHALT